MPRYTNVCGLSPKNCRRRTPYRQDPDDESLRRHPRRPSKRSSNDVLQQGLANHHQSFVAWMVIYGASIALSKCAILLLYVRVFTTCKKAFTITACLVGFVIVATGIANTFIAIFQCSPESFVWDKSIKGGVCINEVAWTRYMAIPNVVTGAVMLVMPMPIVWRLNVDVSAKIALTATFLHGIM